jgi:NAD/NADP transhydrogenase beta subunit
MRKIEQREFFASLGFFSLFLIISGSVGPSSYVVVVFLVLLLYFANLGFTKIQLVCVLLLNVGAQIFAKYLLLEHSKELEIEFLNSLCLISGYLGWWLILSGARRSRQRVSY